MKTEVESNFRELIEGIGRTQDELKSASSPIEEYLTTVAAQIVSQLKQSLRDAGVDQNSLLSQSIGGGDVPLVETTDKGTTITVSANDYWKYINDGVNGVNRNVGGAYSFKTLKPSIQMAKSIEGWAGRRSIGNSSNIKSISYAIATKVKRDGISPTHFVDKVITDEFINEISDRLSEEFGKKLILNLD